MKESGQSGNAAGIHIPESVVLSAIGNGELPDKNSTLHQLIDSVPHFIAVVDTSGRYLLVNKKHEEWFQLPREKIIGQELSKIHRPETYATIAAHINEVLGGRPVCFEHPMIGRDGKNYHFDVRYIPRFAAGGGVTGFFILALDVTHRQRAEEQLRSNARRFELIAQMSAGVLGGRSSTELAQWLAAKVREAFAVDACVIRVMEITGLQLLGSAGVPEAQLPARLPLAGLGKAIVSGRRPVVVPDVRVHEPACDDARQPEGFDFNSFAGVPLMVGESVVGVLAIYSTQARRDFSAVDVSHLQIMAAHTAVSLSNENLYKTVRAQNERLETAVKEQRQLQEQFRQAQKMEAVGQLSGGVAHDFNNLLAVISGNVSLIETDPNLSQEQRETIGEIRLAAERASALTRQLLAFSRRQPLQPRNLDLNTVVDNLARMIRRILDERIAVQISPAPAPAPVFADAAMLEQVILNIVVNARDAMPSGGKLTVTVSPADLDEAAAKALPGARPGEFIQLAITDTGTGIAPEIMPRIFEPFFTTKEPGKGTGLGLATVYGIVQQHEGWVTVRSRPGGGTAFEIFLPRLPRTELFAPPPALPAEVRGGTETILVVEDEPSLRKVFVSGLARRGYRVIQCNSGVEALQEWSDRISEIHLLITDIVMPGGVGGRELARRFQSRHPHLKVMFMSGYDAETGGRDTGLVEGVNFLAKPFDQIELARFVRASLDRN